MAPETTSRTKASKHIIGSVGLEARAIAIFVVLAAIALFGLPHLQANLVTSALAVIDIALVFIVFKGDVRIG